jgi:hypothetical protein
MKYPLWQTCPKSPWKNGDCFLCLGRARSLSHRSLQAIVNANILAEFPETPAV